MTPYHCQIPQPGGPSLACNVTSYSMVVTFQGHDNFRPLFMNLLSWLTYAAVADIVVLMPHDDWRYEGQTVMDAKYKSRIKSWHETKRHKVSMIGLPAKLEPDPGSKFSLASVLKRATNKLSSKAILFMDGSTLWPGNNRGIQAGFELWKQNPYGLIAPNNINNNYNRYDNRSPTSPMICPPQQQPSSSSSQITTTTADLDSMWSSFCQVSDGTIPNDITALHQQYQNILDMNGVFLHKDMLCLIQQPPISTILVQDFGPSLPVQEADDKNKDDNRDNNRQAAATMVSIRSMVAVTLLQISGSPPLLFPARIARPRNETKNYNDNWHYLPPPQEAEAMARMIRNNTITQQTALLSMLGYFGTGLASSSNCAQ